MQTKTWFLVAHGFKSYVDLGKFYTISLVHLIVKDIHMQQFSSIAIK